MLLAIAAFSFTACTTKEVRVVEAPADTEASEDTAPEATEPEATDVPFTLPMVMETVPAVTEAPVTIPPVSNDTTNDGILDDFEYTILVQVLTEAGYGYASQDTSEELGASYCALSASSSTPDEFFQSEFNAIVDAGLDTAEMGFAIGAIMSVMCDSELVWLGI